MADSSLILVLIATFVFTKSNTKHKYLNKNTTHVFQTCLPAGTYCDVISGSKSNGVYTGKTENVEVTVQLALRFYMMKKMAYWQFTPK